MVTMWTGLAGNFFNMGLRKLIWCLSILLRDPNAREFPNNLLDRLDPCQPALPIWICLWPSFGPRSAIPGRDCRCVTPLGGHFHSQCITAGLLEITPFAGCLYGNWERPSLLPFSRDGWNLLHGSTCISNELSYYRYVRR